MTGTADTTSPSPAASGGDDRTPHRYTAALADAIERRWQERWETEHVYRAPGPGDDGFDPSRPKFYCLDMFPYPSGAGLHVGHPEGYTATDIISRFRRLRGENVLHVMGWDAFGLPAEQYAIQTGVHPAITTGKSIDNFRRQLKRFGFCYDWEREFATIDEDYYRWTQWIWLLAYDAWYDRQADRARTITELTDELEAGTLAVSVDHDPVPAGSDGARSWSSLDAAAQRAFIDDQRLAYLSEQMVNWCPKLGTVLANEEVIDGRSERGGFPVHRRPLRQWMFRITAYAERLLNDLALVQWPESTRTMQTAWIGRSEGAEIDFAVDDPPAGAGSSLRVYTTRPDTVFGATFMVLAPEHPLVDAVLAAPTPETDAAAVRAYVDAARDRSEIDRMAESREKTGVFSGVSAVNPATGARIPIWIADYVLMGYGHGAIMAVPAHDDRDFEFAKTFDLPIVEVLEPTDGPAEPGTCFAGDGRAINSSNDDVSLDGRPTAEAKARICDWLESSGRGRRRVNYKLRDWLFSRQRYWGEPFPVVFDEHGHHHAVSASCLPVKLPDLEDYRPVESDDPAPMLAKATEWVESTAGAVGIDPRVLPADAPVRRETNTMPGWAGSCWYYLRFCDPKNDEHFIAPEIERYWMGRRDGGPGGVDLYIGGAEHSVLHLLYARFWHKLLYDFGHVSTPEPFGRLFHQGLITSFAYQRDDKSLVPVDEVEARDDETFIETATGKPVTQTVAKMSKALKNVVNPDDVIAEYGADTFRLYEMYMGPLEASKPWNLQDIQGPFRFLQRAWRLVVDETTGELIVRDAPDDEIERQLHRTIAKVGQDIDRLAFNTAIAAMIELVNAATSSGGFTRDQIERFAIILSPFAPHIAEEIWHRLGHADSIVTSSWPTVDESKLQDDTIEMPVQILGKVRGKITVPADAPNDAIEAAALADPRIAELLEGKTVRKVIIVPRKIVNIVAN